jgi:hypothetical protein
MTLETPGEALVRQRNDPDVVRDLDLELRKRHEAANAALKSAPVSLS